MDRTVGTMHTRTRACGLDRIGFFLHCFEFSQYRKLVETSSIYQLYMNVYLRKDLTLASDRFKDI
jgi:hypothetical protein